jgi:hypothetical protein
MKSVFHYTRQSLAAGPEAGRGREAICGDPKNRILLLHIRRDRLRYKMAKYKLR